MSVSLAERGWALAQRVLAGAALVALSPLLAALWVAARLGSSGPVLFTQRRRGLGGQPFTIYKLRTLRVGSEGATALGVSAADGRVTALGRALRELKLDELPQLWNVVRGEMALVGPRPLPIALEDELLREIPGFAARWQVRPGLTNLSQTSLVDNRLGADLVADWGERFEGERHLLRYRGPAYDCVLIGLTLCFLARRARAKLLRVRPRALLRGLLARRARSAQAAAATEVLGIPIRNCDYAQTAARVAGWVEQGESRMVCVTPVHSLIDSFSHPGHRAALLASDHNTADGVPVVWAQRLFGHPSASRVYGPDLTLHLLERAERSGWRVAFYGGHPERLPVLLSKLMARFPGLDVVYAHSPPFRPASAAEDEGAVRDLCQTRPDLIFVGLGAPKQEQWMHAHRDRVPGVMVGVGAAFDFHAGAVRQAPAGLQRLGLEWAFRLAMEPRRLFLRYARSNPSYVLRVTWQWLRSLGGATFQVTPSERPARRFAAPVAEPRALDAAQARARRGRQRFRASARLRQTRRAARPRHSPPPTRVWRRASLQPGAEGQAGKGAEQ